MLDQIKIATEYNYGELLDRTDWKARLAINLGLAAPGVALALLVSNPLLQGLGVVWALVNVLPVVQWVIAG